MTLRDKYISPPRGIRMNNPGNIKEPKGGGIEWVGERATDDDPIFEEFTQPVYGIRALARILLVYQNKYDLYTLRGIINRWAPPRDNNDTEAYIHSVAKSMPIPMPPGYTFRLKNSKVIFEGLIKAIIKHENGCQPYSDELIRVAMRMAKAPR